MAGVRCGSSAGERPPVYSESCGHAPRRHQNQ
eukprot:CAMPEP_0179180158 /NCGR_PEP_ID=MMETSP0796-20121207/89177_1 /TAXON_ID=73915 /ORGANISM="Pyrodinium bahamense, Strain pbaha01" /LENGTH=31 /DNA_ID= /DNA_START= /DNA_END= /DNA_ORIENTATION=